MAWTRIGGLAAAVAVLAMSMGCGFGRSPSRATHRIIAPSPRALLGSPSQAVRDSAAALVRATYVKPNRARWDSLVQTIPMGVKQADVHRQMTAIGATRTQGGSSYIVDWQSWQLDDLWQLECSFANDSLFHYALSERLESVWTTPPHGFSGKWRTYYANGQAHYDIVYQHGTYAVFTFFHSDGSIGGVSKYDRYGSVVDEIDYYPSGRVKVRGIYREGKRGVWTWYNEDGSIQSRYAP